MLEAIEERVALLTQNAIQAVGASYIINYAAVKLNSAYMAVAKLPRNKAPRVSLSTACESVGVVIEVSQAALQDGEPKRIALNTYNMVPVS